MSLAAVREEMSARGTDSGIRVAEMGRKALVIDGTADDGRHAKLGVATSGFGCCASCIPRCTKFNTVWRNKWLRWEIRGIIGVIVTNPQSEQV